MAYHNGPVAKTITRDLDRRRPRRQAQVVVRMSPEQRDALRAAAERHGTNITALVLDRLAADLAEPEQQRAG